MKWILPLLLLQLASPSVSVAGCEGGLSRLLLKLQNQAYHVKTGNLVNFRTLTHKINSRHYPIVKRWVILVELRHMHPLNYPIPMMVEKLEARTAALQANKGAILQTGLDIELQKSLLPSGDVMKVIRDREGRYVVKDGNSRLGALRKVFPGNLRIEVEMYQVTDADILDLVEQIRAENGLSD